MSRLISRSPENAARRRVDAGGNLFARPVRLSPGCKRMDAGRSQEPNPQADRSSALVQVDGIPVSRRGGVHAGTAGTGGIHGRSSRARCRERGITLAAAVIGLQVPGPVQCGDRPCSLRPKMERPAAGGLPVGRRAGPALCRDRQRPGLGIHQGEEPPGTGARMDCYVVRCGKLFHGPASPMVLHSR
jgi:hypothetical protein